eukprot:11223147-Lingulodinium_polyedra.AAC.1
MTGGASLAAGEAANGCSGADGPQSDGPPPTQAASSLPGILPGILPDGGEPVTEGGPAGGHHAGDCPGGPSG